ncbi:MAG: NADAR family protein [Lachnospiraceae bacterium]
MKIVCFHNPDEENGYLSNWYLSQFRSGGQVFSSMEQFMMYRKAVCFQDYKTAEKILNTDDVAKIKKLGRQVSNYNENYWNGIRQLVVCEGLIAKFTQNESLKKLLIQTADSVLAECAVRDRIWGIGLSMTDPKRLEIGNWKGQNLLGYSLMMVREHLKDDGKKNRYRKDIWEKDS